MYQIEQVPDRAKGNTRTQRWVITGQDSATVDLDRVQEPALVHIAGNQAHKSFAVSSYGPDGKLIAPLVTTVDPYEGMHPLDFGQVRHTTRLEIKATGPWRIEIIPLTLDVIQARALDIPDHRRGKADDVFFLRGATPGKLLVVNCSDRHLAIETFSGDLNDFRLLVNTTRKRQETLDLASDTSAIVIRSTDSWEIAISASGETPAAPPAPCKDA